MTIITRHAACYLGDRPVVFGLTDAAWPDARSQCLVMRNSHSAIAVERQHDEMIVRSMRL